MEELKILSDTYTAEKVEVHRLIRWELPKAWYSSSTHPTPSRLIHFCAFPFLCTFWGARSLYCISCTWVLRDRLEGAIRLQEQDMEKSRQVLNTYEVLGEEFDKLVKEYTQLKQAAENKRWTLQEFNKAYRWGWVGPGGLTLQGDHLLVFLLKGPSPPEATFTQGRVGTLVQNTIVL